MNKEPAYTYLGLLAVVVVSWGIVPCFAELGGLPGDVTTMWVNWFAVIAVGLILAIRGSFPHLVALPPQKLFQMASLGVVWPLTYSLAYFGSISTGSAAFTTIINYTWPLFAMIFGYLLNGGKKLFTPLARGLVLFSIAAVGVSFAWGIGTMEVTLVGFLLGLIAGITQGFYSAYTDKHTMDAWVLTFVIEVVTAVGATIFVLVRGTFMVPPIESLFYLLIVGAVSNGIGFWAFVKGTMLTSNAEPKARATWLIGCCLVPFGQIVALVIAGIPVSLAMWFGVILISGGLFFYRFATKE